MIFCVEDDGNIRDLVIYTLATTGLDAKGFEEGSAFFKALENEIPDLVLLDIMLPGEDGMTILKKLKSSNRTKNIPVIMLTAKGTEFDKVMGLDAGADDFVVKPFGMMELLSRIKAVLRRTQKESRKDYELGVLRIDTQRHRVFVAGDEITLTLKEYELLKYFMQNINMVLSRDQLLANIWGYDFEGETRTIDVHVRTLRQKLGEAGAYIETVRGVGYRIGEKHAK